jgi:hypothetical protein
LAGQGGSYISKLDRYELKYVIPYDLVEPMTEFLMAYCVLDYHSEIAVNNFYQVNSLYYDTPNLTFAKNRIYTKSPRFNMRARAYDDGTKAPYFLEIKVKDGNIVNKYRATIDAAEWPYMFTDKNYRTDAQGKPSEMKNKELFYRTALKYNASPRIYTRYRRRAFVSVVDEYVRVTMDINLQYHLEDKYTLIANDSKLTNYDHENVFVSKSDRSTGSNVILELKCYPHQVPLWLIDMIKYFELDRTSFSKYVQSLTTAIDYDITFNNHYNFNDRENTYI